MGSFWKLLEAFFRHALNVSRCAMQVGPIECNQGPDVSAGEKARQQPQEVHPRPADPLPADPIPCGSCTRHPSPLLKTYHSKPHLQLIRLPCHREHEIPLAPAGSRSLPPDPARSRRIPLSPAGSYSPGIPCDRFVTQLMDNTKNETFKLEQSLLHAVSRLQVSLNEIRDNKGVPELSRGASRSALVASSAFTQTMEAPASELSYAAPMPQSVMPPSIVPPSVINLQKATSAAEAAAAAASAPPNVLGLDAKPPPPLKRTASGGSSSSTGRREWVC